QLAGDPGGQGHETGADERERDLAPPADGPAERVVDEPGEDDPGETDADRLPVREVGDGGIDEPGVRVEVVEDDEQGETREPGRVRLPLEPVEGLGHLGRREPVLLRVVETAPVDAPELAGAPGVRVLTTLRWAQREVETDEVERGADPRDPRDHVEHPKKDVEGVSQVRVQRSFAIATSSRHPVSSSSSREQVMRSRSTSRISDLGLRSTNTTNRKPKRRSYWVLSVARSTRTQGLVSLPCSAAERAERPLVCPIAGCAPSASTFSSSLISARTAWAFARGSSTAASRSTSRVRPSKSSESSSILSCRGNSRIRTAKRATGRGNARLRGRSRARRG